MIEINPAYMSVIGAVNYAQELGISIHLAAAIAFARRGLGFSEKLSSRISLVPTRNGSHVTFSLPAIGGQLRAARVIGAAVRSLYGSHELIRRLERPRGSRNP